MRWVYDIIMWSLYTRIEVILVLVLDLILLKSQVP